VLVGLTPLIPVPILDDRVKAYLERRLTREIARSRGVALSEDDVRAIGETPGDGMLGRLGMGVLLLPLRIILRKVLLVLNVKRASDAASAAYHRGYLLDVALDAGAHPPRRAAAELRAAIDATLQASPHSPIGAAVRLSFEGSNALLRQALGALIAALKRLRGAKGDGDLAGAVEKAEAKDAYASLIGRLRTSIESVPAGHFHEIEERLLRTLSDPPGTGS